MSEIFFDLKFDNEKSRVWIIYIFATNLEQQ